MEFRRMCFSHPIQTCHHFVGFRFWKLFKEKKSEHWTRITMTIAHSVLVLFDNKHSARPLNSSNTMSREATKGQVADVYGQLHPKETPELISQKRTEMESEIEKLAADTKQNLQQAQERCPELLTDDFKLMFLRCEIFNAHVSLLLYPVIRY
jgi:hypothetical protein